MKFSIFFAIPLLIESMFLEEAISGVGMVFTLTVGAPERMEARLTFLHFEPGRVDLIVCFATLHEFSVVDGLVQAIAFDAFCPLYSTNTSSIAPLPVVFALKDAWIHVGTSNSSNKPSDIEPLVDEGFGLRATLNISYVDLYDSHVRFGRNLYDSQFQD